MKLILLLFACVAVETLNCQAQSPQAQAQSPPQGRQALRLLSYNIHHGEGVDGKLDLERIAAVIKKSEADVVALQEVDVRVPRSGKVDQPQQLSQMLNMQVVFGGNIELDGGHYGNAVLSRFPIKAHRNDPLPNDNGGEQRGVLSVELEIANGTLITLLATHLDHRPDPRQRENSAKFINGLLASAKDPQPFLLVGDLNATLQSTVLREFQLRWKSSSPSELPTTPVNKPNRQIDFVLLPLQPADSPLVIQAVSTRVLDEALASDHRPILAALEILSSAVDQ